MKTRAALYFVLFITVFPLYAGIRRGITSVSSSDLPSSSFYPLTENWEYFENEFLAPSVFYPVRTAGKDSEIVNLPKIWGSLYNVRKFRDCRNSVTWHLRVENLRPETVYGMMLYDKIGTGCVVYANGKKAGQAGIPAVNPDKTVMGFSMQPVYMQSDSAGIIDIVIHNSNKTYRMGGIWGRFSIAEQPYFMHWYNGKINRRLLLSGILGVFVLYNMLLFFLMNKNRMNLYLALLSLVLLVRTLTGEFSIFGVFFPHFPFDAELRLEFLALPSIPLFLLLYIESLAGKTGRSGFIRIAEYIFSAALILCICLPSSITNRFIPLYEILLVAGVIYAVRFIVMQRTRIGTAGCVVNLISITTMLFAAVHDISDEFIFPMAPFDTVLLPYSFVIVSGVQSAIAAGQRKQLLVENMALSQRLRQLNESYRRFVPAAVRSILQCRRVEAIVPGNSKTIDAVFLYIHIRNFASITEKMDASSAFHMMNEAVLKAVSLISRYNGFVGSSTESSITVIFPDRKTNVYECTSQILSVLNSMKCSFELFAGIHCGKVVIGALGTENRLAVTAVSPDFDAVISLESYSGPDESTAVVVSRNAYIALGDAPKGFSVCKTESEAGL